jgi:hypothetical protein
MIEWILFSVLLLLWGLGALGGVMGGGRKREGRRRESDEEAWEEFHRTGEGVYMSIVAMKL